MSVGVVFKFTIIKPHFKVILYPTSTCTLYVYICTCLVTVLTNPVTPDMCSAHVHTYAQGHVRSVTVQAYVYACVRVTSKSACATGHLISLAPTRIQVKDALLSTLHETLPNGVGVGTKVTRHHFTPCGTNLVSSSSFQGNTCILVGWNVCPQPPSLDLCFVFDTGSALSLFITRFIQFWSYYCLIKLWDTLTTKVQIATCNCHQSTIYTDTTMTFYMCSLTLSLFCCC